MIGKSVAAACAACLIAACIPASAGAQNGIASFYDLHGRTTANGEKANRHGMTAAHRTLPFGTRVRVTNKQNGRSIVVRINDRGPFIRGRVIDVTPAGARALGFTQRGVTRVSLSVKPLETRSRTAQAESAQESGRESVQ